jgi:GNAT superfamily N-acetyltransferase
MAQPPPRIQIREATLDEAEAIAVVLRAAFVEYEPLYTPGGFAATTPTPEQIVGRWAAGPVWVAVRDGALAGTIAAVPKGDSVYVRSMAVQAAARGLGIGDLLLGAVERYAVDRGARRLFLSTTPFLARAIRLYERWGFWRTADGPHELFGTPLFTMVKPLVPGA